MKQGLRISGKNTSTFHYCSIICFSCPKCEELSSEWQKLTVNFNNDESSETGIAKYDCTNKYENICGGKNNV